MERMRGLDHQCQRAGMDKVDHQHLVHLQSGSAKPESPLGTRSLSKLWSPWSVCLGKKLRLGRMK